MLSFLDEHKIQTLFFVISKDQIRNSHESKLEDVDRFSIKAIESKDEISLHHLTTILPSPSLDFHSRLPVSFDDESIDNQIFSRINPIMEETTTFSPEVYLDNNLRVDDNQMISENGYHPDESSFMMSDELCDTCQIR